MKKITALLICLMLPFTSFAFYTDVEDGMYKESINNLSMYGVINGNGDGTFNPGGNITRSEFAKITSVVSGEDVSMDEGCLFTDVSDGFWANGYINCAAKNNLIIGYPDGTFHPYENLSYAQTVTVVLRLLGYGTQQLGNNYPDAYIKKAQEMGLTEGLSFSPNDIIDRQTVCYIINNALMCDINGTTRKEKLIANLDYAVSDECIILASGKDNSELTFDEVATSSGTYKTLYDGVEDYTSKTVKLILNNDNKICGVIDMGGERRRIAVESVAGNQVAYRENGSLKTIDFDDSALVYYKLSKNTFGNVSADINSGSVIDIYYKNGEYDYAVISEKNLLGPKVVYSGGNASEMWNYGEGLRVIRDGYEKSLSDIETYDVLYYDSELNTLYAYCDKVSGVYEKALPTKAQIKTVTVSGKSYELETQDAVNALGEYSNSFKINDYVTLLLGKDGKAAGVIPKNSQTDNTNYGVLLSCEKKLVDSTQDYYLKVLTVTGQTQEFKTDRDYASYRGRVIHYNFENGYLKPEVQSVNKDFSGDVDKNIQSIDGIRLAADAKIIDVAYIPAANETSSASAVVTEISEITKNTLSSGDILYVKFDGNGKIAFIVLNNVTMQGYKFGVIKSVTKLSGSSTYTLNIGGTESVYNVAFVSNNYAGQPIMACIEDNKLIRILPLGKIAAKGKVEQLNREYVTIGGVQYKLAKNAAVYKINNNELSLVDIDDLTAGKYSTPEIYADRSVENGGLIRVLKLNIEE